MNTYKIDLTVGPNVSLAKFSTAPFAEMYKLTGAYSYLAIDINLKHVEIETQAMKPTRKTDLDERRGVVKIHLPMALSGYHFTEVLLSDRGMRALSYLAYQADFTGQEVAVVSPRQYIDALYFIASRFTDAVNEELVTIPAEAIHLKEWRLKVTSSEGKSVRQLQMLSKIGTVDELYDLETDKPIRTQSDLNDSIEARARKAAVEGLHIEGLGRRFELLYQRCVLNQDVEISGIPESFKDRKTAKEASRSVAVSMRSILAGCKEMCSQSKKTVAVSQNESNDLPMQRVTSTAKEIMPKDRAVNDGNTIVMPQRLAMPAKIGSFVILCHQPNEGQYDQASGKQLNVQESRLKADDVTNAADFGLALEATRVDKRSTERTSWARRQRPYPTYEKAIRPCVADQFQAEFDFGSATILC
jgi:hypothetical protein